VLGVIPGQPQPSQKRFEMLVWQALCGFDPAHPVYVEAESKKVGNVALPDALIDAMRASPCLRVDLPDDERVALLLEDYPFFVSDPAFFCQRLDTLTALRGRALIEQWQSMVHTGQTEAVVRELLQKHYDPGYASSTRRNFAQFDRAAAVPLPDRSAASLARAAAQILMPAPAQCP
jgi:tRNA 2-selenouridine synthase